MSRSRRLLALVLGILGALLALGALIWFVVVPRRLAPMVASHLSAAYGGRVEVGAAHVGAAGSSLTDLRLYEEGPDQNPEPWASVREADADVTLAGVATGHTAPRHLTLRGADVRLHFDRAGHLLTRIPRSTTKGAGLPEIAVRDSRIAIHQDGRPEMVVSGVSLQISSVANGLALTGTIADPQWGNWTMEGEVDPSTGAGSADLKTAGTHVTQAMLDELPFVPAKTWKEVRLEGDTSCDFVMRIGRTAKDFHYRVTLDPKNTLVNVSSIGLIAERASGQVVVEDNVVRLDNVQGDAAGGTLRLPKANFDFRGAGSKLAFLVNADKLDIHKLPKTWKLPRQIQGRLSGSADILLTIASGRVRTSGTGEGTIHDVTIAGQKAKPVRLKLQAGETGFQFHSQAPRPAESTLVAVLTARQLERPASTGQEIPLGWLVNRTVDVITDAVDLVRASIQASRDRIAQFIEAPPTPSRALDANLAMTDVDVDKLLKGFGIRVPVELSGRLTFQVKASIPIDTTGDLRTYRVDGAAALSTLSVAGLRMEHVQARISLRNGVFDIQDLTGRVPDGGASGTFTGSATAQIKPEGDVTVRLHGLDLPLAAMVAQTPAGAAALAGSLSGDIEARVPMARMKDPAAWHASGQLQSKSISAYGQTATDVNATVRVEKGSLRAENLEARIAGLPVSGQAELSLAGAYPFRASATLTAEDLKEVERLAPKVRLPVSLAGRLSANADATGTLRPLKYEVAGSAQGRDVQVAGVLLDELALRWRTDPDKVTLSNVQGKLYRGSLTGSATVPLKPEVAGRVDIGFQGMDVAALARAIPRMPIRLEGRADGSIHGTMPPAQATKPRTFSAKLDLAAPRLRVQGIPAEKLVGTIEYDQGAVDYKLKGQALGGTFDVNGRLPAPDDSNPAQKGDGRLVLRGVRLGPLWNALMGPGGSPPVRGLLDVDVRYQTGPDWQPTGGGTVVVSRLRWGQSLLADRLTVGLDLTRGQLRVRDISGGIDGGTLRGRAGLRFTPGQAGWFNVTLDAVDVGQILAPWPEVARHFAGAATITARGTLGRRISGSGQIFLLRGRMGGVEVTDGRIPFTFEAGLEGAHVEIRDAALQAGRGRLTGHGTFDAGEETRLSARLDFLHVDLQALLREVSGTTSVPAGRVSGRLTLDGGNLRSINDVTGLLEANLGQTQAFQVPVLQQLVPFIIPAGSANLSFDTGSLRARIGRGAAHIERLGLEGRSVRLFVEGDVTLQGRLALEVTATTGQLGPSPLILQQLGLKVPTGGPVPLGLVLQVSSFLSNRVVRLHVGGTMRSPSIQVKPLALLSQEAVLFFLYRAGVPLP